MLDRLVVVKRLVEHAENGKAGVVPVAPDYGLRLTREQLVRTVAVMPQPGHIVLLVHQQADSVTVGELLRMGGVCQTTHHIEAAGLEVAQLLVKELQIVRRAESAREKGACVRTLHEKTFFIEAEKTGLIRFKNFEPCVNGFSVREYGIGRPGGNIHLVEIGVVNVPIGEMRYRELHAVGGTPGGSAYRCLRAVERDALERRRNAGGKLDLRVRGRIVQRKLNGKPAAFAVGPDKHVRYRNHRLERNVHRLRKPLRAAERVLLPGQPVEHLVRTGAEHPDCKQVFPLPQRVRHIQSALCDVAGVIAEINAVEPHFRVVGRPLQLHHNPLARSGAKPRLEPVFIPNHRMPAERRALARHGGGQPRLGEAVVPALRLAGLRLVGMDAPAVIEADGRCLFHCLHKKPP